MHQTYGYSHGPREYKDPNKSHFGKKFLSYFVILVAGIFIFLRLFYGFLPLPLLSPAKAFGDIAPSKRIQVEPKDLLKQTPFDCGAFNMSAAINTLSQRKTTPQDLMEEVGLKKFKTGILPETVVKMLQNREDISAKIRTIRWFSKEDKVKYLKSELSKENPLILFVEKKGFLHFLSVYGYEGDTFFLYDSWMSEQDALFTVDDNGEEIGNVSISSESLLKMWEKAEKFGMYKWVVISVEKKS